VSCIVIAAKMDKDPLSLCTMEHSHAEDSADLACSNSSTTSPAPSSNARIPPAATVLSHWLKWGMSGRRLFQLTPLFLQDGLQLVKCLCIVHLNLFQDVHLSQSLQYLARGLQQLVVRLLQFLLKLLHAEIHGLFFSHMDLNVIFQLQVLAYHVLFLHGLRASYSRSFWFNYINSHIIRKIDLYVWLLILLMPMTGEGTLAGNTGLEAFGVGALWSWDTSPLTLGGLLSVATNFDLFIFHSSTKTQGLFQYLNLFNIFLAADNLLSLRSSGISELGQECYSLKMTQQ
jgi:hypothetical protein